MLRLQEKTLQGRRLLILVGLVTLTALSSVAQAPPSADTLRVDKATLRLYVEAVGKQA
jgi:hypothetical protein